MISFLCLIYIFCYKNSIWRIFFFDLKIIIDLDNILSLIMCFLFIMNCVFIFEKMYKYSYLW